MKVEPLIWHGCYDDNWKGFITDASHAHPAKFSKALIERIYDHLLDMRWIKRGDVVGDPFGGVGTGALVAAYRGMRHVSVELEPKFIGLARENFDRHARRLYMMGCIQPIILQGDSRRFHLLTMQAIVTSPPYAKVFRGQVSQIDMEKIRGNKSGKMSQLSNGHVATYGDSKGQVADLPVGDLSAVVASPPYAGIAAGAGGLNTKPARNPGEQSGRSVESASQSGNWSKELLRYGDEPGQVARLDEGSVEAVVTSPPFTQGYQSGGGINKKGYGPNGEDKVGERTYQSLGGDRSDQNVEKLKCDSVIDAIATSPPYLGGGHHPDQTGSWNTNGRGMNKGKTGLGSKESASYGKTDGQVGQAATPETYWLAMSKIYQSCFLALRPGGVIAIVVKDFVKDKKRMRLCDDTATLLKHCGFVELERIHAMLTSEKREGDFFNGETVTKKERKSFFRRLHEAKVPQGDERRIDWEEVLIFRKRA